MNKINLQFKLEKPALDKNLLVRCSIGALVGSGLKGVITVLSGATFSTLAILGWALAGSIAALATKFFKKIDQETQVAPVKIGPPAVVVKKSLDQCFSEQWDAFASNYSQEKFNQLFQEKNIKVLENDAYSVVWNPKAFSVAVIKFAKDNHGSCTTPKAAWEFAENNLTEFTNYLIEIKRQTKQLPAFEENAADFLAAYIPIRMTDGSWSYIRGRAGKAAFENDIRNFLNFVSKAL